jgi:hypothetical protein
VKFIEEAARIGKFNVELTPPAALLRSRSNQYFNSTDSPFNDCVYSVALGVLDMCVSEFTVTDLRASMTPWFVIDEPDLVLVTQTVSVKTTYARAVLTIFKPFTFQTWTFLIFGMIPLLGILVICHEYDETGSAFPKTDEFLEYDHDGQNLLVRRRIPLYRHLVRAVYTSYLGVLQATYSLPVVTPGGKLHVLGVAFFTLVLLAVCKFLGVPKHECCCMRPALTNHLSSHRHRKACILIGGEEFSRANHVVGGSDEIWIPVLRRSHDPCCSEQFA